MERTYHRNDIEAQVAKRRLQQREGLEAAKTGYLIAKIQKGGQEEVMASKVVFDNIEAKLPSESQLEPLPRLVRNPRLHIEQMQTIGQTMSLLDFSELDLLIYSGMLVKNPERITNLHSILPSILTKNEFKEKFTKLFQN